MYNIVTPGFVTKELSVPKNILLPNYIKNYETFLDEIPKEPEIKNSEQIRKMKKSCSLAKYILDTTSKMLKVIL